jgi:glycosyltransferase involved in cell wall biosynthesis
VSNPLLSVVIPAHNEERRLPPSLEKIDHFQSEQAFETEVVIVENGSHDRTFEIASDLAKDRPYLRVIKLEGRGKGLAVRQGMLAARGEYRFICDADLSMPIEQVVRFLPPMLDRPAVAIASREVKGAVRFHEPAYRHFIGRVFNLIVRTLALPGLQDTQCGFKLFRADVAERVFPLQTLDGMSFDVEVLFIARRMGYCIQEVAIDWYHDPDTRVRLVEDSLRMFYDLITIRRNAAQGLYGGTTKPGT